MAFFCVVLASIVFAGFTWKRGRCLLRPLWFSSSSYRAYATSFSSGVGLERFALRSLRRCGRYIASGWLYIGKQRTTGDAFHVSSVATGSRTTAESGQG